MNLQTHSITDWVRLRGGIKVSASTRDTEEVRNACSPKETGYTCCLDKNGEALDLLANDAVGEFPGVHCQDSFLAALNQDIRAIKSGDVMSRVFHFGHDFDAELDELIEQWEPHMGDCCKSCGYWEAWERNPGAYLDTTEEEYYWEEVLCDACCDMLEEVCK